MKEVLERECKWEVDDDFVLPGLDDVVPGGEVEHSTIELTSAYFDTADRDLSAHGLLLRRREGDDDAGWQLKMPDSNGRIEIRYPLADTMPSDLSALLTGVSLGKQLVNVATIHTTRKRSRITDPTSHQLVAEIADDHVCATVDEGTGEPIRWREVEVELGPAADEVPRKLAKRLASAGAKPSRYPSKLARVAAVSSTEDRPAHAGKAEEVLGRYMHAQIEQFFACDVGLRRGQDPIHDTRVAIRRLQHLTGFRQAARAVRERGCRGGTQVVRGPDRRCPRLPGAAPPIHYRAQRAASGVGGVAVRTSTSVIGG